MPFANINPFCFFSLLFFPYKPLNLALRINRNSHFSISSAMSDMLTSKIRTVALERGNGVYCRRYICVYTVVKNVQIKVIYR